MYRDLFIFVAALIAVFAILGRVAYSLDKASCHAKARSFEDVSYGFIQGCMVKHNGRWLPLDNIRGFDDKG